MVNFSCLDEFCPLEGMQINLFNNGNLNEVIIREVNCLKKWCGEILSVHPVVGGSSTFPSSHRPRGVVGYLANGKMDRSDLSPF